MIPEGGLGSDQGVPTSPTKAKKESSRERRERKYFSLTSGRNAKAKIKREDLGAGGDG